MKLIKKKKKKPYKRLFKWCKSGGKYHLYAIKKELYKSNLNLAIKKKLLILSKNIIKLKRWTGKKDTKSFYSIEWNQTRVIQVNFTANLYNTMKHNCTYGYFLQKLHNNNF